MSNDHTLVRATLVPEIIRLIAKYYNIPEDEAMTRFYSSNTAKAFSDDDTGLYGASALNVAGNLIMERDSTINTSLL